MSKIKENFILVAIALFLIRLLVYGSSIGEALALASLSALYAFNLYLDNKKEVPINEELKKRFDSLVIEVGELKTTVNAQKLGNAFKGRV